MSDFFARAVEIVLSLGKANDRSSRAFILGEAERREARRLAAWICVGLGIIYFAAWLAWRWITR
jgi:hypothetical protein